VTNLHITVPTAGTWLQAEQLTVGDYLLSNNGQYRLTYQVGRESFMTGSCLKYSCLK
jgi:hypothetical protein